MLVGAVSGEGTVVGYITNRTPEGELAKDRQPDLFLPRSFSSHAQEADQGTRKACLTPTPKGMSNSVLTQPWTKVKSGSLTFTSALSHSASLQPSPLAEETLVEELYNLLWTSSNPQPAQRSELRNSVLISPLELPGAPDGKGKDWYATRTSTVILVGKDGRAKLVERDTFKVVDGVARLVNGPEGSGAIEGRKGGQRVFDWQLE